MSGLPALYVILMLFVGLPILAGATFLMRLTVIYAPLIGRIFEERPVFLPLRVKPEESGESAEFTTDDGLTLSGSYLRARTSERAGVLIYCHEFLSDRWSFRPYIDHLRDLGFDIFTFDFRNHGRSDSEPDYTPMHWASDREVRDLRAALRYLRSRPDRDPAGYGLFGVSRGGTTALLVSPGERDVWGVITDGAFPTKGTMVSYILRWAEIYVASELFLLVVPRWVYVFLAGFGRRQSERRRRCRFPEVEAAVARKGPRPWLMIHGGRDTYISPEIARDLFDCAREPKELWLVPDAKHNRCRERDPGAYAARLLDFIDRFAPRRPLTASASFESEAVGAGDAPVELPIKFVTGLVAPSLETEVATPVTG